MAGLKGAAITCASVSDRIPGACPSHSPGPSAPTCSEPSPHLPVTRRGWSLVFPLSIIVCGLGFVGILVQRDRRALHDLLAGTAVIYSWDARAARLRFLARTAGRPRPGPG